METDIEEWVQIEGFPRYRISTEGRIYNEAAEKLMKTSVNNFGDPKISLLTETGPRQTRSVAMLVARAFVEQPNILCNRIIHLNGDRTDCRADNIAWRPRWFAWKYTRQLKTDQPAYYRNLSVANVSMERVYKNIVEAGKAEGMLYELIWHSTYSGDPTFPYGHVWVVNERV